MLAKIARKTSINATRSYGAAAAQAQSGDGFKLSKTKKGTTVATLNRDAAQSNICILFRAGSRYDLVPGSSMFTKFFGSSGKGTKSYSGLYLSYLREDTGATLDVNHDREVLQYSTSCAARAVETQLAVLAELTSTTCYPEYEYIAVPENDDTTDSGLRDRMRMNDALATSPIETAQDILCKAAFRSGALGNSLYVPSYMLKKLKPALVNEFIAGTHGQAGMVVLGSGVDHDSLVDAASHLGLPDGGSQSVSEPSKYRGGDNRLQLGGDLATVIVAGEGAALGTAEAAASLVVQALLRGNSAVKHNTSQSPLGKAAKGVPFLSLTGVSQSFQEAGILGFQLQAKAQDAPQLVTDLTAAVKRMAPTEQDVAVAKAKAKSALLPYTEVGNLSHIGRNLLLRGEASSVGDLIQSIDAVTVTSAKAALQKAFHGKLSVAAVGEVNHIPYSDEL